MVQFGGGSKSSSAPTWLLGRGKTKKMGEQMLGQIWPMAFSGDFSSPLARTLYKLSEGEASKKKREEMASLEGQRGMSSPAKTAAVSGLASQAVTAAAGVPTQIWGKLRDELTSFLQPSGQTSTSSTGSSYGVGCQCRIFTEDWTRELESRVRKFRDDHYLPTSFVSLGYKMMASWLVPLMLRSRIIRKLTRLIMLKPMAKFAKLYYGKNPRAMLYLPICYFWVATWSLTARIKYAIP